MDDELSREANASPTQRLSRSFRFGVWNAREGTYAPFVSIRLSRDGGVFASPAEIPGETWTHGPLAPGMLVAEQVDLATSSARPKLHYHRSGVVRASLTGSNIEAATSQYEPLPDRGVSTFLSIVVAHPEKLRRREMRKGDMSTIDGVWPQTVTLSLAIIAPNSRSTSLSDEDAAEIAPMGLVLETPSQFVVDLQGYGHSVLLLGQVRIGEDRPPGDELSITIAAYPESEHGRRPSRVHALWSTGARNPLLGYDEDFLWEADRDSWSYRSAYIRRFNRLPPWERLSGTRREWLTVRVVHMGQRIHRALRHRRRPKVARW
jgi:hypothetical protein